MFLLDPDEVLSREELLQKIWATRLSPAQQTQCLQEAETRGLTYMDLMRVVAASHDATMADPLKREEWLKINQEIESQREAPYGFDPLRRFRALR